MHLAATKTGRSTRPIGKAVCDLLAGSPRLSGWLFPNRSETGSATLKAEIAAIFNAAGLDDARSHDLRRTFGSVAADLGYGDAAIAELLGHARRGVTERHYVRRSDPVMIAAANAIAAKIAGAMAGSGAEIVPLSRHSAG
jgi:integrase